LIRGRFRAFAENLKLPLAFATSALMPSMFDAGGHAGVDVFSTSLRATSPTFLYPRQYSTDPGEPEKPPDGNPSGAPSFQKKYSCSKPNHVSGSSRMVARELLGWASPLAKAPQT